MRTLKGKLDEAEAACKKAEEQLQALNDQAADVEGQVEASADEIRALEDELDAVESKNVELTEKLASMHKECDEGGHANKKMENQGKQDAEKIAKLEKELEVTKAANAEICCKIEAIEAEIDEYEGKLDEQDQRLEDADEEVKALEIDVTQVGNTLRSMEINDKACCDKNDAADLGIMDLGEKLMAKEREATEWEEKDAQLNEMQDEVDAKLAEVREKHEQTKREFDSVLVEIAEM